MRLLKSAVFISLFSELKITSHQLLGGTVRPAFLADDR